MPVKCVWTLHLPISGSGFSAQLLLTFWSLLRTSVPDLTALYLLLCPSALCHSFLLSKTFNCVCFRKQSGSLLKLFFPHFCLNPLLQISENKFSAISCLLDLSSRVCTVLIEISLKMRAITVCLVWHFC